MFQNARFAATIGTSGPGRGEPRRAIPYGGPEQSDKYREERVKLTYRDLVREREDRLPAKVPGREAVKDRGFCGCEVHRRERGGHVPSNQLRSRLARGSWLFGTPQRSPPESTVTVSRSRAQSFSPNIPYIC